ncbi:MAG TPA: hypothetical protein VLW85_05810 [Myxococcales bacterium]|nr:hypothetical protein [Myxococcales bacterium]
MPRRNAFDTFVEEIARRVVERVAELTKGGRGGGRRGPSKLRGRKLDMRCRHPGCKNRSKGPRFHFLCEEHLRSAKK